MDELKRNTLQSGMAVGAAILLLFICIYHTSSVTTLVIALSMAVLAFFSVATRSRWRYLLLIVLTALLAVELFVYHEGKPGGVSGMFVFSVLIRFLLAGLLICFFATLLTREAQKLYYDMQKLAASRQEALATSNRWLSRLNALIGVTSAIGNKSKLQEVLTDGLEQARKVFKADSGLIYRVSRRTEKLIIISSFGYSPEMLERMKGKGITYASACFACSNLEPYMVDNLAGDEKCHRLARVTTGSSLCIPITSGDRLWGVLHLRRRFTDAFTKEDVQLAQAIVYQFALAMQRAYLFDEVDLLAITDPITELYNYRKLGRDLEREVVRSKRYKHSFSFIMADIDHFKKFNDTYGHTAGDEVLRRVAAALDSGRREVDRVYRYGGEEFSVLLPETEGPEALEVAEKLRRRIESTRVAIDGEEEPVGVTISMGVSSYPQDGSESEHIIVSADEAMYVAKESGRNSVIAHWKLHEAEGPAGEVKSST
jgi:diguanylate cyclase (GGDEF)-like protein